MKLLLMSYGGSCDVKLFNGSLKHKEKRYLKSNVTINTCQSFISRDTMDWHFVSLSDCPAGSTLVAAKRDHTDE